MMNLLEQYYHLGDDLQCLSTRFASLAHKCFIHAHLFSLLRRLFYLHKSLVLSLCLHSLQHPNYISAHWCSNPRKSYTSNCSSMSFLRSFGFTLYLALIPQIHARFVLEHESYHFQHAKPLNISSKSNLTTTVYNSSHPTVALQAPKYPNITIGQAWVYPSSPFDLGARAMTCECFAPDSTFPSSEMKDPLADREAPDACCMSNTINQPSSQFCMPSNSTCCGNTFCPPSSTCCGDFCCDLVRTTSL